MCHTRGIRKVFKNSDKHSSLSWSGTGSEDKFYMRLAPYVGQKLPFGWHPWILAVVQVPVKQRLELQNFLRQSGANVIKLFTLIIYCDSMVIP
jgi:hypothetical protein